MVNQDPETERLSASIRRLRSERSWTLDKAATRLGVSRRLLAQLEAGTGNPSLSTLLSVARGFDVHLSDLLDGADAANPVEHSAGPDDGQVLWSSDAGGSATLLAARGPLEVWRWRLEPGDERRSDAHNPGSQETLHVLSGRLELTVDATVTELGKGASAVFATDRPHRYANPFGRATTFTLTVFDPAP